MIAILKHGTTLAQREHLVAWLKNMNLDVHISEGAEVTVLGLIGDTSRIDMDLLKSLEMVDSVKRVSEPYKQANRKFHPNDTVIEVGSVKIGGGNFALIAGPCSVESEEQIIEVAQDPPWRCFQAPHFPLRFPGYEGRGHSASSESQGSYRPSHCHGDHEHFHFGSVRRCRYHPGRRPEYAEF